MTRLATTLAEYSRHVEQLHRKTAEYERLSVAVATNTRHQSRLSRLAKEIGQLQNSIENFSLLIEASRIQGIH